MIIYKIASKLSKYPHIKRFLKDGYQMMGALLSDKKTSPNTIQCVSDQKYENLFGYYDKSPWNADGNKMIYLRVNNADKKYVSNEPAAIILKDLSDNTEDIIAYSNSWNVQQGCMLQWLGPGFDSDILYNDFRDGRYCSIILNLETLKEKIIDFPVYAVSNDGKTAISLDFSRLNTLRPGYGYCNITDLTINELCPDKPCMWKVDLLNNSSLPLFTYRQLSNFEHKKTMDNAHHKVNHIMISPSGTRMMFLHRWIENGLKYDRLFTCDINGENLYNLLDEDMVSHSNWRDDSSIITWANTYENGAHYYILKDRTNEREIFGEDILTVDGHPSFSPNGKLLVTDTYPDFRRKQTLFIADLSKGEIKKIASIFANVKYRNEVRCDLHPRWKRNSKEICFDGAQTFKRQVYTIKIEEE